MFSAQTDRASSHQLTLFNTTAMSQISDSAHHAPSSSPFIELSSVVHEQDTHESHANTADTIRSNASLPSTSQPFLSRLYETYLNTIASPTKRNLYCGIIMSVDLLLCWIAVAPIMYEQPEACPAVSTAALIGYAARYTVGIALVALRVINPLTWQLDPWYLTKATAIYKNSYTAARLMMMLWWMATVCWYADTSTAQCTPALRAVLLVLIVYDGVLFSATTLVAVSLAFIVGPMRVVTTLLPHPTQIRSVMTKTPSSTSSLTSLAALTYNEGMFGADERFCVICLQELVAGDRIRVLHCLHKFHAGCIDEWIARRSTCPYCKSTVTLETETAMTEWDRQKVDNAIAMSLKQNDKLLLTDDQCIV